MVHFSAYSLNLLLKDLEQKFHAHYFIGSNEKKLIDLTTLRQRNNETPMEFLRLFRETKSMCFSLNIPDDQLAGVAVARMLQAIRKKLFGMEFDNLDSCRTDCHS
jgi:hypothetical protein